MRDEVRRGEKWVVGGSRRGRTNSTQVGVRRARCHHRSVSGPNFGSYITQILFEKETVRIFTDARGCWHVGGIRPMVSVDTALVGNLASHAMSWPFALHVSCCMHRPVRHSTCSRLRRTCHAPLLVIGPRYASCVSSFLSYNTQSAYLKVSS